MKCELCKQNFASFVLKVCGKCIKKSPEKTMSYILDAHAASRAKLGLPAQPPKDPEGLVCGICGNNCKIEKNKVGYCGLSKNVKGRIIREIGNEEIGLGYIYKDWHVTNCVASFACAGGTGAGYPTYAMSKGPEIGFANASVFLGTCCYHCLYCQNVDWHTMVKERKPLMKAEELANLILKDKDYTCVCWFGGSPEPQSPFVWNVSRIIREKAKEENRILRICLESNGNFSWHWLKKIAKLSLESGGGIKFDLKASRNSSINIALSGVSNEASYKNFEKLVNYHQKRPEVPFLRASTLLVPHYIDLEEVKSIVKFIADLDKTIPYSLLAFYPHYIFTDVGLTSKSFAEKCFQIAKKAGLQKVNLGNVHLLR